MRLSLTVFAVAFVALFAGAGFTNAVAADSGALVVTDADGNVYHTVTIGSQTWTTENLKTTKFNDGTAIPLVTNEDAWARLTTPAYCWYDNNTASTSGALYNWYTVSSKKLAPVGWHVPTANDWDTLVNYIRDHGNPWIGKALAAKTAWADDATPGAIGCHPDLNNETGFSAIPGGYRFYKGSFGSPVSGYWWTATRGEPEEMSEYDDEVPGPRSSFRLLEYKGAYLSGGDYEVNSGFSVRLVKD